MATGSQAPVSTVDMVDPFVDGSGIALYKFDGDATDESGSYNGTATNVTYGEGKFGQCISSSASSASAVSFGIHHFNVPKTVSFWLKGNVYIQNGQNMVAFPTFSFIPSQFKMYPYNSTASVNTAVLIPMTEDFNSFKHVTIAINYPSVKIYIDSVLKYTGTMSINVSTSSYDFGLWDVSAHSEIRAGSIDQFRIFSRALTQTEVTALYNEGQ